MRKNRGFTLLELLIVVVILGVLALIAAPTLLNAADKAKDGAVKANVSAASSTVTTRLAVNEEDGATAASNAVTDLNGTGTSAAHSPYDTAADAFATSGTAKGSTVLAGSGTTAGTVTPQVAITGYGKAGGASSILVSKVVKGPSGS